MPRNLEVKAKITSIQACITLAEALHAKHAGILRQTDTYFTVSRGRLKLREIHGVHSELIFYEREETSAHRISQFEQFPVSDPDRLKFLLTSACGVKGIVEKERTLFLYNETIRIHLDNVRNLGAFLEFEIPVSDFTDAEKQMERLVRHFHIRPDDYVIKSYIDLIDESAKNQ